MYIFHFFGLIFLAIIVAFSATFWSSSVKKEGRVSMRLGLGMLSWVVAAGFSDVMLGYALGSLGGVPFPDVPGDELARYWWYFGALKVHLFAW